MVMTFGVEPSLNGYRVAVEDVLADQRPVGEVRGLYLAGMAPRPLHLPPVAGPHRTQMFRDEICYCLALVEGMLHGEGE